MTLDLILIKKEGVSPKKNYSEYRDDLREESWFSCCYCSRAEIESAGIGFEIDHYLSQKKYPEKKDSYDNLFWSCRICNNLKDDHPSPEAEKKGYRIFKPDEHPFSEHFELEGDKIRYKDELIGKYTVNVMDLNSLNLCRLREIRQKLFESDQAIALGLRALQSKKLNEISPYLRAKYLSVRKMLELKSGEASDKIDEYILRNLNRSYDIDSDPKKAARFVERRKYLKELHALSSE